MTTAVLIGAQSPLTALEELLSHWGRADGPLDPKEIARLDTAEEFPVSACRELDEAGLPAYYVPVRHGGQLSDFPQLVAMLRAVARADLTVAIAHGKTFLGAVSVWVSGTPATAAWLGEQIMAGAVVCWGLTEQEHGSDLLAGELRAEHSNDGWELNGTKWPINNATRSQLMCVLARTSTDGGARGFSLFLANKLELPFNQARHTDKIRTHGIRGADISGISFRNALLPPSALIGTVGSGSETVLKSLQLTRTACAALSLGAGDHAFRMAIKFAQRRTLYGRRLTEIPLVRHLIGQASTRLLLAEAVTTIATRAVHVLPHEMSVLSAACKAFVPTIVHEAIGQVGELLGARAYLTDFFEHGAFAKLERDHRLVGIFDGSTLVNRQMLVSQIARLARHYGDVDKSTSDRLALLVGGDLPAFAPENLTLASSPGCTLVRAVPELTHRVRTLGCGGPKMLIALAEFESACGKLHEAMAAFRHTAGMAGPRAFALAEQYELCVAGAASLLILSHRPTDDGSWPLLRACLELVVDRLLPGREGDDHIFADLADHVLNASGALTLFPTDQPERCGYGP